jgi:hypothetical protein
MITKEQVAKYAHERFRRELPAEEGLLVVTPASSMRRMFVPVCAATALHQDKRLFMLRKMTAGGNNCRRNGIIPWEEQDFRGRK